MKKTIDWDLVEKTIRHSIRGEIEYSSLFERARKIDPERYSELHARVKAEEMRRVNPYL